jgi:hypothetical protein
MPVITVMLFEHNFSGLLEASHSVRVFLWSFNATVPHHITNMKCVNIHRKIILDAGFVADVKFLFPGLHTHPT